MHSTVCINMLYDDSYNNTYNDAYKYLWSLLYESTLFLQVERNPKPKPKALAQSPKPFYPFYRTEFTLYITTCNNIAITIAIAPYHVE